MKHETILVIEEFGGVGSLTEALKLLGICPAGTVFVEADEKLRRHFKQRHPDAIIFPSIEKVSELDVLTWRKCFPNVTLVLHGGGWPCQDQSRLNANRLGADSARGKLLEPMLQISSWLKNASACRGCLPWKVVEFYENVMFDDADKRIVFEKIGYAPHHIKGDQFMVCRRPRQFWLRNLKIPLGSDLTIQEMHGGEPHEHFLAVECKTELLNVQSYLEKGAERLKPEAGPWPTFTRPVKKVTPPTIAAGLKSASEAAKNRWKGDAYRLQVYHYEDDWLIRDQTGVRRLKAIECSKMMGPNSWHFKNTKVRFTEDEMGQTVGNMFSVVVAARLLCGLLPAAQSYQGDLTKAIWNAWLKMEELEDEAIEEYRSGLPWLPPKLLACSLHCQLCGSAVVGGGQVQSWMMAAPSIDLGVRLALWQATQSPSMLSLSSGNSGLGIFDGNFDASTFQWKSLVHYKVPAATSWNTLVNATEAAIKRILRSLTHQRSVVLVTVKEMEDAHVLFSTAGGLLLPSNVLLLCFWPHAWSSMFFGQAIHCLWWMVLRDGVMPRKVIKAESTRRARAKARQQVGTLQSQVVQPQTLKRYHQAVHALLDFLIARQMSYPTSNPQSDSAACEYIEELWENGDPKGWAGDLLSGLGHLIPSCKGHLAGGWRLHSAWTRAELPLRAAPFTPKMVYALAQKAFDFGWKDTGRSAYLRIPSIPTFGRIVSSP